MESTVKSKPLVSVIMPAYNHAKYIAQSIESVLEQTYYNLELIIVDNHSDDGTSDIAEGFARRDSRVRYRKFKNGGLIANSRNVGLDMATGEFIAFIDSDDLWRKDKLDKQIPLFSNPDVGIVFGYYNIVNSDGSIVLRKDFYPLYRGYVFEKLLMQSFHLATSTVIVRRRLLDDHRLRFREGRQGAEDWDMWLRIAEFSKGDYVDGVIASYRVHSSCVSKGKDGILLSSAATIDDIETHVAEKYFNDIKMSDRLHKACKVSRIVSKHTYECRLFEWPRYLRTIKLSAHVIFMIPLNALGWRLFVITCVYPFFRARRAILNER